MTSVEREKKAIELVQQMDSRLGPLDKVLANYKGAKGKCGNGKYFETKIPNERWKFVDYEKWNEIYMLCRKLKRRQLI